MDWRRCGGIKAILPLRHHLLVAVGTFLKNDFWFLFLKVREMGWTERIGNPNRKRFEDFDVLLCFMVPRISFRRGGSMKSSCRAGDQIFRWFLLLFNTIFRWNFVRKASQRHECIDLEGTMDRELKLFTEMPQRRRVHFYLVSTIWHWCFIVIPRPCLSACVAIAGHISSVSMNYTEDVDLFILIQYLHADPTLESQESGSLKIAGSFLIMSLIGSFLQLHD
ncbi:UNVERIFIED_CONTAM: hypothetical protein Sindi_2737200 [Sesamum indicum]